MKLKELSIKGAFEVENFNAVDERGLFVKTYHDSIFRESGFIDKFRESYYSISKRNVIRGMHFQLPPFDHEKLVYVTEGEIIDVILDLRKGSETFKLFASVKLTAHKNSILIPKGVAHGFLTLSESATVVYNVSQEYHAESDAGILWNSFGYNWPTESHIISQRDADLLHIDKFESPF